MYGLKQAACLDFENLVKLLATHRYFPIQEYPRFWKHQTHSTVFNICVDSFGIKSNSPDDTHHPINLIVKCFKFSINWEGKNYPGLTLDWK